MKRTSVPTFILAIVAAMAALVVAPVPASATAASLGAASYASTGADIAGWNWVRSPGNTATWTFDVAGLAGAKPHSIYLNVTALVTNGANGGSGYSASAVKFNVTCGASSKLLVTRLYNPFKPMDPANSGGLGYYAYGASSSFLDLAKFPGCTTLTVTSAFPFTSGRHVAFNQGSVTLGFSR